MDGKYIKKESKTEYMTSIQLLSWMAQGNSMLDNMTGAQVMEFMNNIPYDIKVILEKENLMPGDQNTNEFVNKTSDSFAATDYGEQNKIVITINAWSEFEKIKVRGLESGKRIKQAFPELILDASDNMNKSIFKERIGSVKTVAGLRNMPKIREAIERQVPINQLFFEVRDITDHKDNINKDMFIKMLEKSGADTAELKNKKLELYVGGCFKDTHASFYNQVVLDQKLWEILNSRLSMQLILKNLKDDNIIDSRSFGDGYAAIMTYFGVFNIKDSTENDAIVYDPAKLLTIEDGFEILERIKDPCVSRDQVIAKYKKDIETLKVIEGDKLNRYRLFITLTSIFEKFEDLLKGRKDIQNLVYDKDEKDPQMKYLTAMINLNMAGDNTVDSSAITKNYLIDQLNMRNAVVFIMAFFKAMHELETAFKTENEGFDQFK